MKILGAVARLVRLACSIAVGIAIGNYAGHWLVDLVLR